VAASRSKSTSKSKPKHRTPARSLRTAPAEEPKDGILATHAVDLAAVGVGTLAVLTALAVWLHALGPVGRGLDRLLADLVGNVRYLVPLLLVAIVVIMVATRERIEPTRLWVGGSLGLLSLCGLAGLTNGNPSLGDPVAALAKAGGYLGALIGHSLSRALGTVGATVVLVAVLFVAAVVMTGIPLKTAVSGIGRGIRRAGSVMAAWWSGSSIAQRNAGTERGTEEAPFEAPVEMASNESPEPMAPDEAPADLPVPAKAVRAKRPKVIPVAPGEWTLPPLSLLRTSNAQRLDQRQVDQAGADLVTALAAHGVDTTLVGSTVGPTVTRYELELGPGVKVARVTSLSKDIAYAMASPDVRILAPIPGRSAIGVEVPNHQRQLVTLGDLLSSPEADEAEHPLTVALGRDIAGRTVMQNLAEFPHVLISGATGAGKSSAINSLISSILMRTTPDQVRMILVDPKRVELGQYNDLPHLLTPVVVDPKKAANALAWAVKEMERRYDILAAHGVRDITSYHEARAAGSLKPVGPPDDRAAIDAIARRAKAAASGEPFDAEHDEEIPEDSGDEGFDPLPFVVVVVDELNDLMMVAARDVEESVVRIAQMARAVGIHLVLATQRPSVDVITGVIKANIPSRMAFSVSSLADSRVILDQPGAERLVGKGDMLLLTASSNVARRIQAPWISEEEVRGITAFWRAQGGQSELAVAISELDGGGSGSGSMGGDDDDALLAKARALVIQNQIGSTSMLQRKLRVGFARAGRLMDLLEDQGVVGPSTGSKARAVLVSADDYDAH